MSEQIELIEGEGSKTVEDAQKLKLARENARFYLMVGFYFGSDK